MSSSRKGLVSDSGQSPAPRAQQPSLRAALFDFDGTLTPSLPLWVKAYHLALAQFGVTISDAEVLQRCFFRDWSDVAADFAVCTADEMRLQVDQGLQTAFLRAELFPKAQAIVEHCRDHGLKTALVTSSPRHLIASVATRLDIEHLFDFVICGDEVRNYKPHPEPVLTALNALHCEPARAVMIGDSHADVLAGKSAGTRTALFMPDDHHAFHDTERLRATNPDFIFDDHEQLLAFLDLPQLKCEV